MKHKTWFRLILKAIGVLVIALSAGEAVTFVWTVFLEFRDSGLVPLWNSYVFAFGLGKLITLAIGFYLLLGGERLVNFCIPSNRAYCPNCGYDVSESLFAKNCSECGVTLPTGNGLEG